MKYCNLVQNHRMPMSNPSCTVHVLCNLAYATSRNVTITRKITESIPFLLIEASLSEPHTNEKIAVLTYLCVACNQALHLPRNNWGEPEQANRVYEKILVLVCVCVRDTSTTCFARACIVCTPSNRADISK